MECGCLFCRFGLHRAVISVLSTSNKKAPEKTGALQKLRQYGGVRGTSRQRRGVRQSLLPLLELGGKLRLFQDLVLAPIAILFIAALLCSTVPPWLPRGLLGLMLPLTN